LVSLGVVVSLPPVLVSLGVVCDGVVPLSVDVSLPLQPTITTDASTAAASKLIHFVI
jgi:hypothetical protein